MASASSVRFENSWAGFPPGSAASPCRLIHALAIPSWFAGTMSCGAAGLAATLLGMRDGFLPPTINLEEPDPACDLDYVPLEARSVEIENAVCNCIGFGSKNSALVVSQA